MTQITFVLTPAMVDAMLGVLIVTAGDILFGVILALSRGEFDFGKLPSFLRATVLPYIGGLLILGALATANNIKIGDVDVSGTLMAAYFASAAFVAGKLLKDIGLKVAQLIGRDSNA